MPCSQPRQRCHPEPSEGSGSVARARPTAARQLFKITQLPKTRRVPGFRCWEPGSWVSILCYSALSTASNAFWLGGPGTGAVREAIVLDHSTPKKHGGCPGFRCWEPGSWVSILCYSALSTRAMRFGWWSGHDLQSQSNCSRSLNSKKHGGWPGHGRRSRGNCSGSLNSKKHEGCPGFRCWEPGSWGKDCFFLFGGVHCEQCVLPVVKGPTAPGPLSRMTD